VISVLILTFNEEENLPRCLDAVSWSNDIVVYDSLSTDRTAELARERGARVFQRAFGGYGEQREAARREVPYKNPWVLAVDADELHEVARRGSGPPHAWRMRRKDHFWGRWIKHSTLYPSWFIRFYRPEWIRYETRSVHEYPVVDGPVGELRGHLIHHSFAKGTGDWMRKHVQYAELEALENLRSLDEGMSVGGLLSIDPVRRRRALKELSFRLPFRPALRFTYMYFLRGGFLDGRPGFTYCRLLAIYEYLITLEIKAARRRARGLVV
jgi:glycosyltransferase involved in cell wall biosynthesis